MHGRDHRHHIGDAAFRQEGTLTRQQLVGEQVRQQWAGGGLEQARQEERQLRVCQLARAHSHRVARAARCKGRATWGLGDFSGCLFGLGLGSCLGFGHCVSLACCTVSQHMCYYWASTGPCTQLREG